MPQDPYDFQSYDLPALPYIPYDTPTVNTSQPYNAQAQTSSNDTYPPAVPSVYESTPSYAQTFAAPAQTTMDTPEQRVAAPVPEKKKRRRWLAIGALILIVLVVAASAFALTSYLNRSTPMKTLDTFCSALQDGKYQIAYEQFSPTMQANFTESQFAGLFASDGIATCSHGIASESGTSTTTSLHLLHKTSKGINNDRVVVTKNSSNQWKINDIQAVS